jgi:hypothetical protein
VRLANYIAVPATTIFVGVTLLEYEVDIDLMDRTIVRFRYLAGGTVYFDFKVFVIEGVMHPIEEHDETFQQNIQKLSKIAETIKF